MRRHAQYSPTNIHVNVNTMSKSLSSKDALQEFFGYILIVR
jgi:hypothetical protein